MTKYELSLSPEYVPSWTVVDAVRELFQNALDQETQCQDNAMFVNYNDGVLSIGNKTSVLEAKSLLLGSSTKRDDANTIGQFGEGYKIAALVLTRLGKKMTIYNYGVRETWRPRFSKSRKYNATILVFDVYKSTNWPWSQFEDHNLTITVEDITVDEYATIAASNLHIQPARSVVEGSAHIGDILLDEHLKGKIFVNGLYVCMKDDYHCGYNLRPSAIKLDRDRKLVSDWDLKWLASKVWASASDQRHDTLLKLVRESAPDVEYMHDYLPYFYHGDRDKFYNGAYTSFREEYGADAVPVSNQSELEQISTECPKAKPIVVSSNYCGLIKLSSYYSDPTPSRRVKSLKERLDEWEQEYLQYVPKRGRAEYAAIMREVRQCLT